MYVKMFAQILDSSIAEDYLVRLVFEDLLLLADAEGLVDMTLSAVSRRTNVPLEIVTRGIEKLSEPDRSSRSLKEEGRRIVLIDPQRPWGWRIVNYLDYRGIRDGADRKEYFRERKREQRARLSKTVQDGHGQSGNVADSPKNVTQEEAEAELNVREQRVGRARSMRALSPTPKKRLRRKLTREQTLATHVLQCCGIVITKTLLDLTVQAIKIVAQREQKEGRQSSVDLEDASKLLQLRMEVAGKNDFDNKGAAFWIQDGKFKQRVLEECTRNTTF